MKGRKARGTPPADLLVCLPTRSHLTLRPKPICSPGGPSYPNAKRLIHHNHRLKQSGLRGGDGGSQSSQLLWSTSKHIGSDISEPTSPKVTCAGQIKVRPNAGGSCKNWRSVMEEIEKIHNTNKKQKKTKKPSWVEAMGFKKDVMQFLTCLRAVRFDFRCFGSFPGADITTSSDCDDEDSDSDEGQKEVEENDDDNESSKTVFSKWFMVLQENQNNSVNGDIGKSNYIQADGGETTAPPPNALLLMRCRSAPTKSWLEENEEEEEEEERKAKMAMEEEISKKKMEEDDLVVMRYDTNFYKLSSDIAKETWVVGGISKDSLSRSRSWKS